MYQVYLDDSVLYYPGDEQCALLDAVVNLKIGQAGSFECVVPPLNPLYGNIYNRKSMITVYRNNKIIFCGEVRESSKDKNNCKHIYAVGELAFLLDSIQPQYDYGNCTPTSFLAAIISEHNSQVEERKQFTRGYCTVSQGYDTSNKITDYDDSLKAIRSNLVDNLGGCLRVRHSGSARYLDYVPLSSYGSVNSQGINFGENLLDYAENMTSSDIVTQVIPLGARLDNNGDFENRLDIKSVNSGLNYLTSTAAVNSFGHVRKVVVFDGIDNATTLKQAGQEWLTENQYETMTLKVSAVDLSMLDSSIDDMNLGDQIPCYAPPYGLDITLPIQEQTLNLMAPQKDTIVLSATLKNKRQTISGQVGSGATDIKQAVHKEDQKIRAIIAQEVANIMAQFTGTNGGYKIETYDENGLWLNTRYMNAQSVDDATEIMEFSMAGIRMFKGNAGQYTDATKWKSAWTLGGDFCADFITTGTLYGERVKAGTISDVAGNMSWNLETGAVSADQLSVDSTNFKLTNAGIATMTGANINGGTIEQTSGNESLTISETMLIGKRNGARIGYIDLSADTGSGGNVTYDAVFGSDGTTRLEFVTEIDFVDKRTGTTVAWVDGNGYHGPIDESYLST